MALQYTVVQKNGSHILKPKRLPETPDIHVAVHNKSTKMPMVRTLCLVLHNAVVAYSLRILFMENPPFVCADWSPCRPSYLGADWSSDSNLGNLSYWTPISSNHSKHTGKCLFGGLRTSNGVCIHGFKVELLKVIIDKLSRFWNLSTWDTISLWYTNSTITEVHLHIEPIVI